jgi:hypothetical protein
VRVLLSLRFLAPAESKFARPRPRSAIKAGAGYGGSGCIRWFRGGLALSLAGEIPVAPARQNQCQSGDGQAG